jgi:Tfp pilus assembly protein PilF
LLLSTNPRKTCASVSGILGLLPGKEAQVQQRAAVAKALELDPMLPEAYTARAALYLWRDRNWQEAERDLHRALQL